VQLNKSQSYSANKSGLFYITSLLKDLIYDIFRMTPETDVRNIRHREAMKRLHTSYTYNFLPFSRLISRPFLVDVSATGTVNN